MERSEMFPGLSWWMTAIKEYILKKKEHNEKSRVGTKAKEATFSSKSARGWFISGSALELQKKERDTQREKERI